MENDAVWRRDCETLTFSGKRDEIPKIPFSPGNEFIKVTEFGGTGPKRRRREARQSASVRR